MSVRGQMLVGTKPPAVIWRSLGLWFCIIEEIESNIYTSADTVTKNLEPKIKQLPSVQNVHFSICSSDGFYVRVDIEVLFPASLGIHVGSNVTIA